MFKDHGALGAPFSPLWDAGSASCLVPFGGARQPEAGRTLDSLLARG